MARDTLLHLVPAMASRLGRRRAGGQASFFVMITAVILVIAALLVYNVGRLNLTRMHMQNTADSAAYSGAVLMARSYNFAAYSNRAMVANQVAIAQMVGLDSWARYYCLIYTDASCGNFKTNGTAAAIQTALELMSGGQPGVDVLNAYQSATGPMYTGINAATGPLVTALNLIVKALSVTSRTYYDAVLADIGLSAVSQSGLLYDVVKQNDPQAQLSVAGMGAIAVSLAQIQGFAQTYTPLYNQNDPNNRFHNVVMASRDSFSSSRASAEIPPFTSLLVSAGDCLGDGVGFMIASSLGYSGSSTLSSDNATWSAKDSSPFLAEGLCVIEVPTPVGPIPVPIPLIVPIPPSTGQSNTTANTSDQYSIGSYSGLQPYKDVKDLTGNDYTAPTLTLLISRSQNSIATTQQLKVGLSGGPPAPIAGGTLQTPDAQAGQMMQVAASSQVYFVRPVFSDTTTPVAGQYNSLGGQTLYGSFFSPYWEAHLVPTSSAVLAAAGALQ